MTPQHPTIADFEALDASEINESTFHRDFGTDPANVNAFFTWFKAQRAAEREALNRIPPAVFPVQLLPMFPDLFDTSAGMTSVELLGLNWNVNHDVEPLQKYGEERKR